MSNKMRLSLLVVGPILGP